MTGKTFESGTILLAHYPFTDHSTLKLRPVLVVSRTSFNRGGDLVVLPISSQVRADDRYGLVILATDTHFAESGLRMDSTIKWAKPMTITRSVVQRRLGILPPSVMEQISSKMADLFGSGRSD